MASFPHASLVEHLTTAVLVYKISGEIVFTNHAAEVLFQTSKKRVTTSSILPFLQSYHVTPTDFLQRIQTYNDFREYDVNFVLPGGMIRQVDCAFSVVSLAAESWCVLECTHKHQHGLMDAQQSNQAQQEGARFLIRQLAHEIKNPLGGVRGAAQLLRGQLPNKDLTEYTDVIIKESDRLAKLVDRLLGPNKRPNFEQVNVHQVVDHVVQLIEVEAKNTIHLQRDYDPSIPNLVADSTFLIQAVLNIAQNALQAVQEHGMIIFRTRAVRNVTIGSVYHRLAVRVDIIDDGPGIPKDLQDKIFYPLVTGKTQGTGLGLSIAQSLVYQHQGMITCKSEPGHTMFTMTLALEPRGYEQPTCMDHR